MKKVKYIVLSGYVGKVLRGLKLEQIDASRDYCSLASVPNKLNGRTKEETRELVSAKMRLDRITKAIDALGDTQLGDYRVK